MTLLRYAGIIVFLAAAAVSFITLRKRRSNLIAFYSGRQILYREWLQLYGPEARPKIQTYLRCFAESFRVPPNIIHKLGPNDGVMDFYRRDYREGEPDALETNQFIRRIKDAFGYTPSNEDGTLTMGQLFEKITRIRRK